MEGKLSNSLSKTSMLVAKLSKYNESKLVITLITAAKTDPQDSMSRESSAP